MGSWLVYSAQVSNASRSVMTPKNPVTSQEKRFPISATGSPPIDQAVCEIKQRDTNPVTGPGTRLCCRAKKRPGPDGPAFLCLSLGELLVLDLVVHQAVLDLIEGVHRLHDRPRLGLSEHRDLGRLLDDLVDGHRQHGRHRPLVREVQHLELVQELVDVVHLVPAGILRPLNPQLAGRHPLDGSAGLVDTRHFSLSRPKSLGPPGILSRTTCNKSGLW